MNQPNASDPDVTQSTSGPLPSLYLGHGAPPLLEDEAWMAELRSWAEQLPRPKRILIVSAHWQSAPVAISSTRRVPLVYDFYGFPEHYYRMTYEAPAAPDLAADVRALLPADEPVLELEGRGLDHGAWVPLKAMYPDADIPVLQMSMPDLDPTHLLALGRRLAPLRDDGTLIIGSGFMTHGLPFIHEYMGHTHDAPSWSVEFDRWAAEALDRGDLDELLAFEERAPGMPYAHPTVEHFAPLFVTLGASTKLDDGPTTTIEGFWWGLSKRAFQVS
jgi:4,5-DOPA dioxygenase extradiol